MEIEKLNGVRYAGFYAIVHFGTKDDPQNAPFFMKADGTFTANPHNAYISTFRQDVETLACKENKKLEQENHPLAGCVLPVGMFVADPNWEEPKVALPNNSLGLGFWWFTFGLAHPLAGMVQGVFASSEQKAREVMVEFYGHYWAACYKTHTPIYRSDMEKVWIGGEEYRPISGFLKEGDLYQ